MLLGPFPRLANSESLFWSLIGLLVVAVAVGGVAVGAEVATPAAPAKNKVTYINEHQQTTKQLLSGSKKRMCN